LNTWPIPDPFLKEKGLNKNSVTIAILTIAQTSLRMKLEPLHNCK
jgi:hypothetical protein